MHLRQLGVKSSTSTCPKSRNHIDHVTPSVLSTRHPYPIVLYVRHPSFLILPATLQIPSCLISGLAADVMQTTYLSGRPHNRAACQPDMLDISQVSHVLLLSFCPRPSGLPFSSFISARFAPSILVFKPTCLALAKVNNQT